MTNVDLVVLGLGYDIVGVFIIARTFAATSLWNLQIQSGTYYGGNQATFLALWLQRTDAKWGFPLILLGFAFQIVGMYGVPVPFDWIALLWMALLPLWGAYDEHKNYVLRNYEAKFKLLMKKRKEQ